MGKVWRYLVEKDARDQTSESTTAKASVDSRAVEEKKCKLSRTLDIGCRASCPVTWGSGSRALKGWDAKLKLQSVCTSVGMYVSRCSGGPLEAPWKASCTWADGQWP